MKRISGNSIFLIITAYAVIQGSGIMLATVSMVLLINAISK